MFGGLKIGGHEILSLDICNNFFSKDYKLYIYYRLGGILNQKIFNQE